MIRNFLSKRGKTSDWNLNNEFTKLLPGQIGIEYLDSGLVKMKVGPDNENLSKTDWSAIEYAYPDPSIYKSEGITFKDSATLTTSVGRLYLTNLKEPVTSQDAATKYYVDQRSPSVEVDNIHNGTTGGGTKMIYLNTLDSSLGTMICAMSMSMVTFSSPDSISFTAVFSGTALQSDARMAFVGYTGQLEFSSGGNHPGGYQIVTQQMVSTASEVYVQFNISVESDKTNGLCYPMIFAFRCDAA